MLGQIDFVSLFCQFCSAGWHCWSWCLCGGLPAAGGVTRFSTVRSPGISPSIVAIGAGALLSQARSEDSQRCDVTDLSEPNLPFMRVEDESTNGNDSRPESKNSAVAFASG